LLPTPELASALTELHVSGNRPGRFDET
jgi:hypothetical protein